MRPGLNIAVTVRVTVGLSSWPARYPHACGHNVGKVAAGPGFALAEEWCLRRRRASSTNLLATLLSIRPSAERRAFPALLELTYA